MKTKTEAVQPSSSDTGRPEFSPAFLRWLITLTVGTLVMVFLIERATIHSDVRIVLQPWLIAASVTVQEGLREYEGKAETTSYETDRYAMLAGVLVGSILAPTLLLFGWRGSLRHKDEKQRVLQPWNIAFFLGGVLLVPTVFPSLPVAITSPLTLQQIRSRQPIAEARDAMMYEMTLIGFDARQFKARPFALGGGEGSYFGYNIPPEKAATEHGSYITVEVGEDMIVFKGTSARYPASNILLVLDKEGAFKQWTFGGEFH